MSIALTRFYEILNSIKSKLNDITERGEQDWPYSNIPCDVVPGLPKKDNNLRCLYLSREMFVASKFI